MTTIQISVTEADIAAAGRPATRCATCPIALAVRRHFPTALVSETKVYIDYPDNFMLLPATARQFISDFDVGCEVQPIIFELEVGE